MERNPGRFRIGEIYEKYAELGWRNVETRVDPDSSKLRDCGGDVRLEPWFLSIVGTAAPAASQSIVGPSATAASQSQLVPCPDQTYSSPKKRSLSITRESHVGSSFMVESILPDVPRGFLI